MVAFTSCTSAANAPECSSDPSSPGLNLIRDVTIPCDDHANSPRTPLQSPTRHSSSTEPQPDLTPLRRRFLDEVGMSPATPPRTPSPTKKGASPSKSSESPSKGRSSPTKQRLEIRPGGFYFECELPLSKITPKKQAHQALTPTRRTPSPTKMASGMQATMSRDPSPPKTTPSRCASPDKQTPTRRPHESVMAKQNTPAQSGVEKVAAIKSSATKNDIPSKSATPDPLASTSLRKPATPKPRNGGQSGRPSPTKSIKLASKVAKDAITPKPLRFAAGQPGLKQDAASNKTSSLATPNSSNSPRPSLSSVAKVQTRPTRGGSFNIGESMAALNKHTPRSRNAEPNQPTAGSDVSGPPTPLRKEAAKLARIDYVRLPYSKHENAAKEPEAQVQSVQLSDAAPEPHIYASPFHIKEQTSHYRPLPPALEASSSSEAGPTRLTKQVKFQGSEPTPSRLPRPKTTRRAGTDPLLHLAMQQEMNTLSKSLNNSLGVDFRSAGSQNTSQLSSIVSAVLGSDQGTPHPKKRTQSLRTASDVTDVSNASGSSISVAGPNMSETQKQLTTPSTPNAAKNTGKSLPKGTPDRVIKDTRAAANAPDNRHHLRKVVSHASGFIRPQTTSSTHSETPQKKPTVRGLPSTPSSVRAAPLTPKPRVTATPAKAKATGTIPQSARKSAFEPAARKTASPARVRTQQVHSNVKQEPTPRPVFVGAQDIAARVAEWNKPKPSKPLRTNPSPPKPKPEVRDSYTPPGSPPKSHAPTTVAGQKTPTSLHPRTPPTLSPNTLTALHPRTPYRARGSTTKRSAPGTPVQGRTPTQNRTPGQARAIARLRADPMATRTPSKGIQDSLSEAIDRKIEEDRKREFVWRG